MQNTTNYGFNIVEGTDIVNPLTQLNPIFTSLDTILKAVADLTIDAATCIKSGNIHSITRSNTDAEVLRFTATGDWNAGDIMTVDGVTVTPYLPNGNALIDKAFLINTEVLMSVVGTRATVYTNANVASNIEYTAGTTVAQAIATASTAAGTSYDAGNSVEDILDASSTVSGITYKGITLQFFKVGKVIVVAFGGTTNDLIAGNEIIYSLSGAYRNFSHSDTNLTNGQRCVIDSNSHNIRFTGAVQSGTQIRGTVIYLASNYDALT